jgi:hypothetical protein
MVSVPSLVVVPLPGPHSVTAAVDGSLVKASGMLVVVSGTAAALSGWAEHEPNRIADAKIAVTAAQRRGMGTLPSCLYVRYRRDRGLVRGEFSGY